MRRYLLILCLGLLFFAANATGKKTSKPPKPKAVLVTDTGTQVDVRRYDDVAIKAISKQPEFNYHEDKVDLGWWKRFWRWVWSLFNFKSPVGKTTNKFLEILLKILYYGLIACGAVAVIFIILKLAGVDIGSLIRGRSKEVALPYSEYLEDINAIDFDNEVETATAQGNYRLAVRLLYLKCLKRLSDAGLINWQINKTNTSYVTELADAQKRAAFGSLTNQFEYVWYGEFNIGQRTYSQIQDNFNDFNKSIS